MSGCQRCEKEAVREVEVNGRVWELCYQCSVFAEKQFDGVPA